MKAHARPAKDEANYAASVVCHLSKLFASISFLKGFKYCCCTRNGEGNLFFLQCYYVGPHGRGGGVNLTLMDKYYTHGFVNISVFVRQQRISFTWLRLSAKISSCPLSSRWCL
jgi:hypothetical protein